MNKMTRFFSTPKEKAQTGKEITTTDATFTENQQSQVDTPTDPVIQSDTEALLNLEYLVHYYRTTQPHSPVAYMLEKAQAWLKLPLPELLETVFADDDRLLSEIKSRLGLTHSGDKNSATAYPFSNTNGHTEKKIESSAVNESTDFLDKEKKTSAEAHVHSLSNDQELM